ncbi:hypothetical protein BEH_07865 [Priestia filamentosa]|uniref:PD-(D/E)XK endonuclease-like domain-containing protein n=1 Tax=Priestia filamentosa TaxID=1402861 RepID=A0A0H4KEI4_9BACI|nr:PD-(D/E)XK nuclease family protein [Priestia filamentosa]AKO92025.1 hypothetical protein BEH_07865 [Priestia filamentosa]
MGARDKLVIPKKFIKKYGEKFPLWSYSKINTLDNCKHEYYLSRVKKLKSEDNIYTVSGTCAHDIIQDYYENKIKYNQMADLFETKFFDIEISDFRFSSDEQKNTSMRNKYKSCVKDFFLTHKPIETKVLTEKLIWVDVDGHVFMGYVDAIIKDQDGNYNIIDWKTSTIYKGAKIKLHGKQLLLYALGLHQMGVPLDKIKVAWNFLKYVNVTYKQKNGKYKTTSSERHKWVAAIKTPLKKDIKSVYNMEDWEADIKLEELISANSLDGLDEEIQNKYKLDDCYVYAEVSEELVNELKRDLVAGIEEINERGDEEDKWNREPIQPKDEFYCNVLCGVKRHCKFYKAYQEKNKKYQSEEDKLLEEIDNILSL